MHITKLSFITLSVSLDRALFKARESVVPDHRYIPSRYRDQGFADPDSYIV